MSPNALGVLFMAFGTFVFTLNDALAKLLVEDLSPGQILLLRSLTGAILIAPLMMRAGLRAVAAPPKIGQHVLRLLVILLEIAAFYVAIRLLPLADALAVYQATPILVVVLAVLMLGERVRWRRWTAIGVGMAGLVVVMVASGREFKVDLSSGLLSGAALGLALALAGTLLYAVMQIQTRQLRDAGDAALIAWHTFGTLALGLVWAPLDWRPMTLYAAGLCVGVGVLGTVGHYFINKALRTAPASVVAPFHYTQIVWAVMLGWLIWSDTPTSLMLVGVAIIIGSGLFILHRERVVKGEKT